MTQETQELLRKVLALAESERAELAGHLIESLDTNIDADVDEAWQQEITRRSDEIRSGRIATIPWPEVRRRAKE